MFRDYVLLVELDAASRRRLVRELAETFPLLVASSVEAAAERLRRHGPPRAVLGSARLAALPGGRDLVAALGARYPRTPVVQCRTGEEDVPGPGLPPLPAPTAHALLAHLVGLAR